MTVLLYSPEVIGHPRVYCRAIADALQGYPCKIVVAIGFTAECGLSESIDLLPLVDRENLTLVETRLFSESGSSSLTAEEIRSLQCTFAVDVTLFVEADKSNVEFVRIAEGSAPRLLGRNLGIFANTAEWYPGEDSFTGEPIRLVGPTIRATLGRAKRAIFGRKKHPRYFYKHTVIKAGVLDEVLVKDERLAKWFGPPVYWMPEISRPLDTRESDSDDVEFTSRQQELRRFLATNGGREPVLYFGDAAFYKGYDWFLKFVLDNPSTCALHPGRTYDDRERCRFDLNVESMRSALRAQGRLLETNSYVASQRVKALFFSSIRLYITTHRLALSSSTMIQAAEFGKPVLVPDRGLIGHRAKTYGIGDVYGYGDLNDLSTVARGLWSSDLERYEAPLKSFVERFNDDAIATFFRSRLLR